MAYDYKKALQEFNIECSDAKLISSSSGNTIKMVYDINDNYILEATNDENFDENKVVNMNKLISRYIEFGIICPQYIQSNDGKYIYFDGEYSTTVREKTDGILLSESKDVNYLNILKELYAYLGKYSAKYRSQDLYQTKSPYSVFDLSPLDSEVDERQANLNLLCEMLKKAGFTDLCNKLIKFNDKIRQELKEIYKKLPRCNYHGTLTNRSILVKDNHFVGLDDFSVCGSEVVVNYFSCEARADLSEDDFTTMAPTDICNKLLKSHRGSLNLILQNYELLPIEKKALELYNKLLYISGFHYYQIYKNVLRTKDRNKVTNLLYMLVV